MLIYDGLGRVMDPYVYMRALADSNVRKRPMLLIEPTRHVMVQQAYQDMGFRMDALGFYTYMPSFSDINIATYRKIDGTEWVMCVRGTASSSDFAVDIKHFLGIGIGATWRYQSALAVAEQVQEAAGRENARICLAGHSLGALVAGKINAELFGGGCETVLYSPAAQLMDQDTFKVYAFPNTYVVAKEDDIVSFGAFIAAPERCYLSEGEYLHSLGSALYQSHNPYDDMDASDRNLSDTAVTTLVNGGKDMAVQQVKKLNAGVGGGLDFGLNVMQKLQQNPSQGISSAIDNTLLDAAAGVMTRVLVENVIEDLVTMAVTSALEALGIALAPIGGMIIMALGLAISAGLTEGFLALFKHAFLLRALPPPHIALLPPPDGHFEQYPYGAIKPL